MSTIDPVEVAFMLRSSSGRPLWDTLKTALLLVAMVGVTVLIFGKAILVIYGLAFAAFAWYLTGTALVGLFDPLAGFYHRLQASYK